MFVCSFIKPSGQRCEARPMKGKNFCYGHHPDLAAVRSENGRRGGRRAGRGRGSGELSEVRDLLREITDRVLDGSLDRGTAIAANLVLNTRVRLIEVSRRVQEQEELLARLGELEERAALVGGRRA